MIPMNKKLAGLVIGGLGVLAPLYAQDSSKPVPYLIKQSVRKQNPQYKRFFGAPRFYNTIDEKIVESEQFARDYLESRKEGLQNPEYLLGSDQFPYVREIRVPQRISSLDINWQGELTDVSQVRKCLLVLCESISGMPWYNNIQFTFCTQQEFERMEKLGRGKQPCMIMLSRDYDAQKGWKIHLYIPTPIPDDQSKEGAVRDFMHFYSHIISSQSDTMCNEAQALAMADLVDAALIENDPGYVKIQKGPLSFSDISSVSSIFAVNIYHGLKHEFEKEWGHAQNGYGRMKLDVNVWNYLNTHKAKDVNAKIKEYLEND